MPYSAAFKKLRDAVNAEHATVAAQMQEYLELAEKMRAYQQGTGPAPTGTEFENWRKGVALAVKLRAAEILPDKLKQSA